MRRLCAVIALGLIAALLICPAAQAREPEKTPSAALTLEDAIERAIKASPRLDAARAGIAAAAGSEQQAYLWPNPEFSFEAENFVGTGPYNGIRNAELTGGLSQLIELGGKRDARQRAGAAARRTAQVELSAAELDVIHDVTIAYMETIAAQETVRLALDLEGMAKKVLDDVTRRVNAARDPLFQKSRADVAYTNARIARERAQSTLLAARQKLARFWGADTVAEQLANDRFFVASAPAALDDYESRLVLTPDLKRYEELRAQREADLSLAQAGAVPDVRATFGLRQFPGTNDTAAIAGVSIPIPLLNQNQGEIARAGAEVRRVTAERQQARLERSQQLVEAWSQWQSAWDEAKALRENALPQAERAFKLSLSGYRQGAFQYLDVLDTERTFFETRNALIAALSRLHAARAQVERLTAPLHPIDPKGTP
jgi:cobalt-zinc-cadmium efflux system outer membrane protein